MRTAVLLLLVTIIAGCAPQKAPYIVDGKEYGITSGLFRDRWWNYYERGVSFAEGGFYQEAISDFETAINQRANDQWRSRTYGMHFLNYFPHRELGRVYFQLKRYDEAIVELEASLRTAESAKAKFYLNKARQGLLEETQGDRSPPTLQISAPIDGEITNRLSIQLTGEAQDDTFVSSVSINKAPLFFELSRQSVLLEEELVLKRGINEITIKATDLTGKHSRRTILVTVDRQAPLITIDEQQIQDGKIAISGFITDSTGIDNYTINGRKLAPMLDSGSGQRLASNKQELAFSQEIELAEGMNTLVLQAQDLAGNITTANLLANDSPGSPLAERSLADPGVSSQLATFLSDSAVTIPSQYALSGDSTDKNPVNIIVKDLSESQTVYYDTLFLEGEVRGNNRIRTVTINDEPILKRQGKRVFFNQLVELDDGMNRFTIAAVDIYGNQTRRDIDVTRKLQKVRQLGSRMSISLLPVEQIGAQSIVGAAVNDTLTAAFVNQGRFRMIERERMEAVLRELDLGQTELVDAATASRIGKIVVADAILIGSVYETEQSIEVLTRLVNTETSTIMAAKDVFEEDKSIAGLKAIMEGLALKYKNTFPLLEGLILKKEGESILVDLGNNRNMKSGMGLILFREGEAVIHPVSGAVLGSETIELGAAKVDDVYDEFARATITEKKRSDQVETLDKVITR